MKTISDRIEVIKSTFDLNNVELAAIAGMTKQAVGQWINNDAEPSHEALVNMREKLGVSDIWVTKGKGPMLLKSPHDEFLKTLEELAADLDEDDKEAVLDIARRFARKNE